MESVTKKGHDQRWLDSIGSVFALFLPKSPKAVRNAGTVLIVSGFILMAIWPSTVGVLLLLLGLFIFFAGCMAE